MDDSLDLEFSVTYRHRIFFTEHAFASGNRVLADLFAGAKVIPIVDSGLASARPGFVAEITAYGKAMGVHFTRTPLVLTGGEAARRSRCHSSRSASVKNSGWTAGIVTFAPFWSVVV